MQELKVLLNILLLIIITTINGKYNKTSKYNPCTFNINILNIPIEDEEYLKDKNEKREFFYGNSHFFYNGNDE